MSQEAAEPTQAFPCPYKCGLAFPTRWEAKRHAKKSRCTPSPSLSPEDIKGAFAKLEKPPKQQEHCDVCGVYFEGHARLKAHYKSAVHHAMLHSFAQRVRAFATDAAVDQAPPAATTSPLLSTVFETSRLVSLNPVPVRAPLQAPSQDSARATPPSRSHKRRQKDTSGKETAARRHKRVTCECGSSYRDGDGKAHRSTVQHRVWAEVEVPKRQQANQKREGEEMANEDHLNKYVPVWNPTTATTNLFRLYKEADVYQRPLARRRKHWRGVEEGSLFQGGDDDGSDEEMDAETAQSRRAEREKSLRDSIVVATIQRSFENITGLDTSKLSNEQRKAQKRKYKNRARFDGNLREATGDKLCFVAVLTSCLPFKDTTKTFYQEMSDKGHVPADVKEGAFVLKKTAAKVVDESCMEEPLPMHFFSRFTLGLPPPLPDMQVCLIALYKARVSRSSRTGESYLSASDSTSWVVCSLSGKIIQRNGKEFIPPSKSLEARLLLARKIQFEMGEGLLQKWAVRECVRKIVDKVIALHEEEQARERRGPSGSPQEALCGVETRKEVQPSPLKWALGVSYSKNKFKF